MSGTTKVVMAAVAFVMVVIAVYFAEKYDPTAPHHTPAVATAATAAPAAPPVPVAPPCIHKVCGERPAALQCEQSSPGYMGYAGPCHRFVILYESHCDCDRWATLPPREAGAP